MTLARWDDLFALLEAHPDLWQDVRSSVLLARQEGRPRKPGEWTLAYLAFVNSGEREIRRWWRAAPPELWDRAGFGRVPGYQAVYEAFVALEEHEDAYRQVANSLVRLAVQESDGKVGHALHVDGTEAETHSRLIHECTGKELDTCTHSLTRRAGSGEAREVRQREAEGIPVDDDTFEIADEIAGDERGLRLRLGQCWYRLSDGDAGVRAYTASNGTAKKWWVGYYNLKAVDHYTGGVLATHVVSASVQEYHAYPGLYERATEAIGHAPAAIVADKGFSVASVYELHTRDGVASVMPWRRSNHEKVRRDHERFDRHGIPRCKHCGHETSFVRFQADTGPNDEPRLWVRCTRPADAACRQTQTIYCKAHWRLLLPLWRTSEAYQVLRASHDNYEHAHHRWRERYAVGGDTKADRPKRRGIGVQRLRASAALIIEWLTICHRQGWLPGSTPINTEPEIRLSRSHAASYTSKILAHRRDLGLSVTDYDGMAEHQAEVAEFLSNSAEGSRRAHATVSARSEPSTDTPANRRRRGDRHDR